MIISYLLHVFSWQSKRRILSQSTFRSCRCIRLVTIHICTMCNKFKKNVFLFQFSFWPIHLRLACKYNFCLKFVVYWSLFILSTDSNIKLRRDGVLNLYPFPRVGRASRNTWQLPKNDLYLGIYCLHFSSSLPFFVQLFSINT